MKSSEIRQLYIDYFTQQGHTAVPSSSLIPENDPTLLFTNAGMNQFKNLFLGLEHRPYTRAVSSQKCVRAGGKHNDLENVGFTARHHTFFEMLGNFSFGDYFKKEAIHYAWELLTQKLKIPKEKLYVTVFETDNEAAQIWHQQEGVPKERIFRFGEKDNFWRMGETGPCGPCTEIFYDHGPRAGQETDPYKGIQSGEDRFVEIWNLVFMQFFEKSPGTMEPLPRPSVDTGAGLERLTAAMQGQLNNYDSDLFWPMIVRATEISHHNDLLKIIAQINLEGIHARISPENKKLIAALRVVADHTRSCSMLIADGALPSNDGRGYVLRRILRRAVRFSQLLSGGTPFLPETAKTLINSMNSIYPELKSRESVILSTIQEEQDRFMSTLESGTTILNQALETLKSKNQNIIPGDVVFKLYDTFGFPLDLTRLMAAEAGFSVDETGFEVEMEHSKARAKSSWKGKSLSHDEAQLISASQDLLDQKGPTRFLGYEHLHSSGHILWSTLHPDKTGLIVLDQTPFYAEGGGQAGDTGQIRNSQFSADIFNTTKMKDIYFHHIRLTQGNISTGQKADLFVNTKVRRNTANHHSATHLLHAALRKILGSHVSQAGSLVDENKLRFDFTHNKSLSLEEIHQIESLVNEQISQSLPVQTQIMSHTEALKKGAVALFGEKYGDQVRVLTMGDFSIELCGGTHVSNTSQIRLFKITNETGVSAGVRRVEATAGEVALHLLNTHYVELEKARNMAGLNVDSSLHQWIDLKKNEIKELEKKLKQAQGSSIDINKIISTASSFELKGKAVQLILADLPIEDREVLSQVSDQIKNKMTSGVSVLIGSGHPSCPIIVTVSKNLHPDLHAGQILRAVAERMGGKGGGRADFAQGSAPQKNQMDLNQLKQLLTSTGR